MAATDTISDMLTRIRNAGLVGHQNTKIPATKMTQNIARVLKEEGFIEDFVEAGEGIKKHLVVSLKYKKIASQSFKDCSESASQD